MKTTTLNLETVYGPATVTIRPVSAAHLAAIGADSTPTDYAISSGEAGDPRAVMAYVRLMVAAGVVEVRFPDDPHPWRVHMGPTDLSRRLLDPVDLEAPGVRPDLPNLTRLLREIAQLSGMGDPFRTEGGEGRLGGEGAGDGADATRPGDPLPH